MKKKEIINKLINYYEYVISGLPKEYAQALDYISDTRVKAGVCYTSYHIFNTSIINEKWVRRNCEEYSIFWGRCPMVADTRNYIFLYLQLRLNILKKERDIKWYQFWKH